RRSLRDHRARKLPCELRPMGHGNHRRHLRRVRARVPPRHRGRARRVVGAAQAMKVAPLAFGFALAATASAAQDFVVEGSCRDGQPHGSYELRDAKGAVRAVGAFNRGKRTGSFLFWSSNGARVAQLPFEDDVLSGTVALWWPPSGRDPDEKPKLEAVYTQ